MERNRRAARSRRRAGERSISTAARSPCRACRSAGDGVFDVASGITLDFVGGASTLSGASFEGDGTLLMSGGSTTLKSGATVSVADLSETGSGTSMTVSEALTYAGDFSQGAGSTTAISSADELSLTGTASLSGTTSGVGTLALGRRERNHRQRRQAFGLPLVDLRRRART